MRVGGWVRGTEREILAQEPWHHVDRKPKEPVVGRWNASWKSPVQAKRTCWPCWPNARTTSTKRRISCSTVRVCFFFVSNPKRWFGMRMGVGIRCRTHASLRDEKGEIPRGMDPFEEPIFLFVRSMFFWISRSKRMDLDRSERCFFSLGSKCKRSIHEKKRRMRIKMRC